jgi:ABC-2 type transport system permease protein
MAVRLYWETGKRQFQQQLAYRTANLAGLVTNGFFGYLRAAILLAAFAGHDALGGYQAADIVTYTWVTQGLIMVVSLWGWNEVEKTIRDGSVVADLAKPFSYLGYWLARDYGRQAYFLLFRCLPILLLGQVLFGLRWPEAPLTWLAGLVSVILAVTVSFAWRFALNLLAFWTIDARGISALAGSAVLFLSGFVIPIRLFPDWLRPVVLALPFASIIQIPCDVFLERFQGAALLGALGQQALWAAVMLGGAQMMVALATRRVITQGG